MVRIAVVGAGPTGIYALQRLLSATPPLSITVFESSARPGTGTPYDASVNAPEHLANIASYELPPVVEGLAGWLDRLPAMAQRRLGVRGKICERVFYPRIALGAYFVAQLRRLAKLAFGAGHRIDVKAKTRVTDIAGLPEGARVTYCDVNGRFRDRTFDYVIVATGHRARASSPAPFTVPAYPAPLRTARGTLDVAVLGASLTAIDVALALALQRGEFQSEGDDVAYVGHRRDSALRIVMLSRRGVLPETDFYFPYPYEPLRRCTADALRTIGADDAPAKLDRAFALFAKELGDEDPGFARRLLLDSLTADTFADAYFATRSSGDPFDDLRRNLDEAETNAANRRTSRWRYAILRSHESFAALTPYLDADDLVRFARGLQRVFADNYAALPPLSVRRLLALHTAGVLSVRSIDSDYELKLSSTGKVEVVEARSARTYDIVVDARGERMAYPEELPFPTLRLQALANRLIEADDEPSLAVNASLRLRRGVNPVDRIYCLAAPFLLGRRPFAQGLTSVHELANLAVGDLLQRVACSTLDEAEGVKLHLDVSLPLILSDGLVVATPSASAVDATPARACAVG